MYEVWRYTDDTGQDGFSTGNPSCYPPRRYTDFNLTAKDNHSRDVIVAKRVMEHVENEEYKNKTTYYMAKKNSVINYDAKKS